MHRYIGSLVTYLGRFGGGGGELSNSYSLALTQAFLKVENFLFF